jgi:hypothetical protein
MTINKHSIEFDFITDERRKFLGISKAEDRPQYDRKKKAFHLFSGRMKTGVGHTFLNLLLSLRNQSRLPLSYHSHDLL